MTDPDLAQIIQQARDMYAGSLLCEFSCLREKHDGRIFTEVTLRTKNGAVATEGPSQLGCRVDAIIPSTIESVMVDSAARASFRYISFHYGSIPVSLSPFEWDRCVVTMECSADAFRWQPVLDWFHRWFDAEDENETTADGLSGVIHFLSEPQFTGTSVTFTTDLGSAPAQAFDDLLEACAASEPSQIGFSSTNPRDKARAEMID